MEEYFAANKNHDVKRRRALELPASLACIGKVGKRWFEDELFVPTPSLSLPPISCPKRF